MDIIHIWYKGPWHRSFSVKKKRDVSTNNVRKRRVKKWHQFLKIENSSKILTFNPKMEKYVWVTKKTMDIIHIWYLNFWHRSFSEKKTCRRTVFVYKIKIIFISLRNGYNHIWDLGFGPTNDNMIGWVLDPHCFFIFIFVLFFLFFYFLKYYNTHT